MSTPLLEAVGIEIVIRHRKKAGIRFNLGGLNSASNNSFQVRRDLRTAFQRTGFFGVDGLVMIP